MSTGQGRGATELWKDPFLLTKMLISPCKSQADAPPPPPRRGLYGVGLLHPHTLSGTKLLDRVVALLLIKQAVEFSVGAI